MTVEPNTQLPRPGQTLDGRYELVRLVAEHGFFSVFEAIDPKATEPVAIKLFSPSGAKRTEVAINRFVSEAKQVQTLLHDNTVRIRNVSRVDDGRPFFVMELLVGERLMDLVGRLDSLDTDSAIDVASQVLGSLSEAHDRGVIHRDLSPKNIWICWASQKEHFVKVLGFGIGKTLRKGLWQSPKDAENYIGSPTYAAPEILRGMQPSAASDIYSVGLILAEMLTGLPVVTGKNEQEIIRKQASMMPLEFPDELSGHALEAVLRRATSKRIQARYADASEMLSELTGETVSRLGPRAIRHTPEELEKSTKVTAEYPVLRVQTTEPTDDKAKDRPAEAISRDEMVTPQALSAVGWGLEPSGAQGEEAAEVDTPPASTTLEPIELVPLPPLSPAPSKTKKATPPALPTPTTAKPPVPPPLPFPPAPPVPFESETVVEPPAPPETKKPDKSPEPALSSEVGEVETGAWTPPGLPIVEEDASGAGRPNYGLPEFKTAEAEPVSPRLPTLPKQTPSIDESIVEDEEQEPQDDGDESAVALTAPFEQVEAPTAPFEPAFENVDDLIDRSAAVGGPLSGEVEVVGRPQVRALTKLSEDHAKVDVSGLHDVAWAQSAKNRRRAAIMAVVVLLLIAVLVLVLLQSQEAGREGVTSEEPTADAPIAPNTSDPPARRVDEGGRAATPPPEIRSGQPGEAAPISTVPTSGEPSTAATGRTPELSTDEPSTGDETATVAMMPSPQGDSNEAPPDQASALTGEGELPPELILDVGVAETSQVALDFLEHALLTGTIAETDRDNASARLFNLYRDLVHNLAEQNLCSAAERRLEAAIEQSELLPPNGVQSLEAQRTEIEDCRERLELDPWDAVLYAELIDRGTERYEEARALPREEEARRQELLELSVQDHFRAERLLRAALIDESISTERRADAVSSLEWVNRRIVNIQCITNHCAAAELLLDESTGTPDVLDEDESMDLEPEREEIEACRTRTTASHGQFSWPVFYQLLEHGSDGHEVPEELAELEAPPPLIHRMYVRIYSRPSRARVYMDDRQIGRTPFLGNIETAEPSVTVMVSKRDHRPITITLDMTGGDAEFNIELERRHPFGQINPLGDRE